MHFQQMSNYHGYLSSMEKEEYNSIRDVVVVTKWNDDLSIYPASWLFCLDRQHNE